MYRACNASSYGLSLNLLNEIRRIKVFMAWLNLDITNITDDPNEDALERMLQLSLQYGIHTFFFFYVDAYEYVDQKNVLRVSDCFIFPPRFSWSHEHGLRENGNEIIFFCKGRLVTSFC